MSDAEQVWAEAWRQHLQDYERETAEAESIYPALVKAASRLGLRRMTYRCGSARDMLLDAFETPNGILLHQPGYRMSHARNEAVSSEAGRRANTVDGANHWRPRTYPIGHSALAESSLASPGLGSRLDITCSHGTYGLTAVQFWEDWRARKPEVVIAPEMCLR